MKAEFNRRTWLKATGLMAAGTLAARRAIAGETAATAQGEVAFQRKLRIKYDVDVFVAGGGPAGTAAAVAARSQGATVFMAEAHSCFGGMGTAGRVPVFMPVSDGVNFLPGGFGRRVLDRLAKEKSLAGPATDIEALKRVYDALVAESGAAFSFQTSLCAVEAAGGRVSHVVCAAPSGLFAVKAKVYIDATGNGDLAAWAGAAFEKGDAQGHLMPGNLCSLWSGIDWKTGLRTDQRGSSPTVTCWRRLSRTGLHGAGPPPHGNAQPRRGARRRQHRPHLRRGRHGRALGHRGAGLRRKSMKEYERYYRGYLKGFENVRLVDTGSLLGVRETRRIHRRLRAGHRGLQGRRFSGRDRRYAYPIDIHPLTTTRRATKSTARSSTKEYRYKKGESYGIRTAC
jgi:hypothetical protein